MMLEDIYFRKRLGIPYIAILLIITCTIVSIPTYFNNELYEVFASHGKAIYWWQYFTGNFEHSIVPKHFFWAHYLGNMFLICLYGCFIERLIGTRRMFIFTVGALVVSCICSRIFVISPMDRGAGASGIAWAYLPMAFFILVQCIKMEKQKVFKSPLLYIMIGGFLFAWVFVTSVSSWEGTNRSHVIATIVGILIPVGWYKAIKETLAKLNNGHEVMVERHKSDHVLIYLWGILPIGMMIILSAYSFNDLDPFVRPINISAYENYEALKVHDGIIHITFDEPVEEVYSICTYTQGDEAMQIETAYSKDRKTIDLSIINYERFKNEKGSISIDGISFKSGQKARLIKLVIE